MSNWGHLYPLRDELTLVELNEREYTVGRDPNCTYVINETQHSQSYYKGISRQHFTLTKKDSGTYLVAKSVTYVNDRKVEEGQKIPLCHNARIHIICGNCKVALFVFMEKSQTEATSLSLPSRIGNKYSISYQLGKGGFGTVSLIFNKNSGKRYAMKSVDIKKGYRKYAENEKKIVLSAVHPCIIKTKDVVDSGSDMYYIVMEMMDGGDLQSRINKGTLTEADTKLISYQLALASQYLHKHGVVHRDIKPPNVLLSSKSNTTLAKLSDFGISKIIKPGTVMETQIGTPGYTAPEVFSGVQNKSPSKVDTWSLGIVIAVCLVNSSPVDERNFSLTFPSHKWSKYSTAQTLVESMLETNPSRRYGSDEILSHPWYQDETLRRQILKLMYPDKSYRSSTAPASHDGMSHSHHREPSHCHPWEKSHRRHGRSCHTHRCHECPTPQNVEPPEEDELREIQFQPPPYGYVPPPYKFCNPQ